MHIRSAAIKVPVPITYSTSTAPGENPGGNIVAMMCCGKFALVFCLCLSCLILYCDTLFAKEIRIGLRAHLGAEVDLKKWQPTADYLGEKIPQHTFVLIPFEINSELNQAVSRGEFDFVLTNPASYVEQKIRYGVSAIATLINRRAGAGYSRFGSVIFTRADRRDVNTFQDLKGKTFMGVDEQGFGGWRIAWRELLLNGIDPYRDFRLLSFAGGIQQNVVYAVGNGKVDAGSVRTDLLERMAQQGEIQLERYKVIEAKQTESFGFLHSTRLYPEWPFAKLSHTPDALASEVASVLYHIPADSPAAKTGRYLGWTLPQDYQPVDDLLKELHVGPYVATNYISWRQAITNYWQPALIVVAIFVAVLVIAYFIHLSNQRLRAIKAELESEIKQRKQAQADLENHQASLEKTVAQRTSALEASNKELESYSYSIAHDLRSPLRSIIGFSQILEQDAEPRLSIEELDALRRIVAAGKHMAGLIDDILQLSRITRSQLHSSTVDLSAICQDIANTIQQLQPGRRVHWKIQEGLAAEGDSSLLKILLQNLLDNAWKFTKDSENPRIEAGMQITRDHPVIFVKDNGTGFDMEFVDKIFMPFQRLHGEQFDGTGIGLATVDRIVQRHGGKIWAESAPGRGACFYFTLGAPHKTDSPQ